MTMKRFFILILLSVGVGTGIYIANNQPDILEYEIAKYGTGISQKELPVDDLCVTTENVLSDTFDLEGEFHSVALFSPNSSTVLYANNIHERIYPASTTKILTCILSILLNFSLYISKYIRLMFCFCLYNKRLQRFY